MRVQLLTSDDRDGEWMEVPDDAMQSGYVNIPRLAAPPSTWYDEPSNVMPVKVERWAIHKRGPSTASDLYGRGSWYVLVDPRVEARLKKAGLWG